MHGHRVKAEEDPDPICPYCGAEFCNTFALMYHVKRCEAHKGKTEPEEVK